MLVTKTPYKKIYNPLSLLKWILKIITSLIHLINSISLINYNHQLHNQRLNMILSNNLQETNRKYHKIYLIKAPKVKYYPIKSYTLLNQFHIQNLN